MQFITNWNLNFDFFKLLLKPNKRNILPFYLFGVKKSGWLHLTKFLPFEFSYNFFKSFLNKFFRSRNSVRLSQLVAR